ncbi:nitrite reductase small subunit NirD [Rhizorhabdus dicambivorans]|uniref:Nitrite reductase (NAD(P)H) small subunit n=1 Tax=Rhizorhabdus dicambivorans TaxID=1850238 RepID=A0A2A4FSR5_9SPHN|nr:nitrite reductase small subunit NirD [Rhizorhabdus dicambivorans]ATE64614.1 nitrite reductase (NAD(P)H) small subunit [Rhizorhabdus dicambivorans]PCE40734.1 nitrite reductase (NAD(P)H) small subunit [Rhizorhabdus dicambivorans]
MVTGDWLDVGALVEIPLRGARTIKTAGSDEIAIFRTAGNKLYALVNRCPHKQGHLSQGIVHGEAVTCPLHNWRISLVSGEALGEDEGCVPTIPVRIDAGRILISRMAMLAALAAEGEGACTEKAAA